MTRTGAIRTFTLGGVAAIVLAVAGVAPVANADGTWRPGMLVLFPDGETARVDNSGATVTFEIGSPKPWGPTISVGAAAAHGAVQATRR